MSAIINDDSEPIVAKSDRIKNWSWVEWDKLESLQLFPPIKSLIDRGFNPLE